LTSTGEKRKKVVAAMQVTLNGKVLDVPDGVTVRALVDHLGLGDGPVAVEINRAIVPRAEHATRAVTSGDTIEIVHFVGGG
jgi:sulfur carrier protein